jgi:Ca2+-transporting ATPase
MTAAVMAAGTLWALAATDHRYGTAYATTFAFTTFVLFQVVNALNVRTEEVSALSRSLPANPVLLGSLALVVTLQVIAVELPAAQGLFGTVALEPVHWAAAAAIASLALVVGEVDRAVRRHRAARRTRAAGPPRREGSHG